MSNANELTTVSESDIIEKRSIDTITAEILLYKHQAGESILQIGARLNEAKEQLSHGEWLDWLNDSIDFSEGTAQRFMRLAREYSNPSLVTELGSSKALALLALPPADRDEFITETHDIAGEEKSVTDMSKRELETAVKERAEAIKAKEAAEKIAKDAEDALKVVESKLERVDERIREAEAAAKAAECEKASIKAELDNLQKADIQLPDEDGQQMMEDLRKQIAAEAKKDAEKKLKTKIEKADVEKERAERALKDAVEANEKLNQESALIRQQQEAKIEKLQKQLAAASSEPVTIFKTHFEGAQDSINKMVGCIMKLKEEPVTQGKLITALKALCEKTVQNLPTAEESK